MLKIICMVCGAFTAPVVHELGHYFVARMIGKDLNWRLQFPRLVFDMPSGTSREDAELIATAGFGAQWIVAFCMSIFLFWSGYGSTVHEFFVGFLAASVLEWWMYPHSSPCNDFNNLDSDDAM